MNAGSSLLFDLPASRVWTGAPSSGPQAGQATLRVLTLTSLFPSTSRPRHGIFVETRLRHLMHDCAVQARVIAPVPWFPFRAACFGPYAKFAATPRRDTRGNGLQVSYPRYLMLPKLGVAFQPDSMARASARELAGLMRSGWEPQLIDAHYFYPDGVAAAMLAESLGLPFVVTARGTDVNVLARMPGPGRKILWAARRAAAVIAVSTRLKEALISLGIEESKIVVLRNGVDTDVFRPQDRQAARQALGLPCGPTLACVGNLVPEKGFSLAIESLRHLPDAHLLVVGEGPLRRELAACAERCGVTGRVRFLRSMPQAELAGVLSAADALLLCSTREGWPNVVLESLACGTPVVATDVGAVKEILTVPWVGRIVSSRDALAFSSAIIELLSASAPREDIVRHAARFDWASVSRGQLALFRQVLACRSTECSTPC